MKSSSFIISCLVVEVPEKLFRWLTGWRFRNWSWSLKSHNEIFQLQAQSKESITYKLMKNIFSDIYGLDFMENAFTYGWKLGESISFLTKRKSLKQESDIVNIFGRPRLFSQLCTRKSKRLGYMAAGSNQQVETISNQMEDTKISSSPVRSLRRLVSSAQAVNKAADSWSTSLPRKVFAPSVLNYVDIKNEVSNLWKCLAGLGRVEFMEATNAQCTLLNGDGIQANEVMIDMNIDIGNRKRLRNEEGKERVEVNSKEHEDEIMVNTNSNAHAEVEIILKKQGLLSSKNR